MSCFKFNICIILSFCTHIHSWLMIHSCSFNRIYSYVPAEPRKNEKPYTQKFDYSQIKSKINTGRSSSPAVPTASADSTGRSFGHSSRARLARVNAHCSSSPSPGSILTNRNLKSGIGVGSLPSKSERIRIADYSHVKSRTDSGQLQRPRSKSSGLSGSQRSSSMNQNKVGKMIIEE